MAQVILLVFEKDSANSPAMGVLHIPLSHIAAIMHEHVHETNLLYRRLPALGRRG
jgi:hypothetical protein